MHRRRKGPMFKMKSGNKTTFKMMGSTSPVKKDPTAEQADFTTSQYLQSEEDVKSLKRNIQAAKTKEQRRIAVDALGARYGLESGELTKQDLGQGTEAMIFASPEGVSVADMEKDYFVKQKVNPKYVQKS